MFRILLAVTVYACLVSGAPQDKDVSDEQNLVPQTESVLDTTPSSDDASVTADSREDDEIEDPSTVAYKYLNEATEPSKIKKESENARNVIVKSVNSPSPRFIPKLSYFQRANEESSAARINFVQRPVRKFISKCRCVRYDKCEKFQITVPRCPEEQFLCCF